MTVKTQKAKRGQTGLIDRKAFWRFCRYSAAGALARSSEGKFPCTLDAYYIDQLLVDQQWRCAVSGVLLEPPSRKQRPFAPSIDRIVPALGYVPGNVRVVCQIVNVAMNAWGLEALQTLVAAMARRK
jgi:hypothetical protein